MFNVLSCFLSISDECSQVAASPAKWDPIQADIWGASEQHPARHHERDIRMRGGEEEWRFQQAPGTGAAGRELHELWLQKCSDIRLQRQLPLQGIKQNPFSLFLKLHLMCLKFNQKFYVEFIITSWRTLISLWIILYGVWTYGLLDTRQESFYFTTCH